MGGKGRSATLKGGESARLKGGESASSTERNARRRANLESSIAQFSESYPAVHFAHATCVCGHRLFKLYEEETEGCAIRVCAACHAEHFIADTELYLDECGDFVQRICRCGVESLELAVGVALYAESNDVRWVYVGAQCRECSCVGVYVDWKLEFSNYKALLEKEAGLQPRPPAPENSDR